MTPATFSSRALLMSAVLSIGTACGSDQICEPGAVSACVCADGASGEQTCLVGGASFDTCHCDAPTRDGGVTPRDGAVSPHDGGVDACAGSPCRNGGTCTSNAMGYTCSCASGYEGTNCETNIDECAAQPCENGGTCVDGVASFTCNCIGDFVGDRCQTHRLELAELTLVVRAPQTWSMANDLATRSGMRLAVVESPETQTIVERIARTSSEPLWIGGFQDTTAPDYAEPLGGWRWSTNTPFNYTGWTQGEPTGGAEDFLEVWGTRGPFAIGRGNDAAGTVTRGAILQVGTGTGVRNPDTDHFYGIVGSGNATWTEANDYASSLWLGDRRGHLVTIETEAEQQWLMANLNPTGQLHFWLGAQQDSAERTFAEPAGGWRWLNGPRLTYTNWATDEPNNGSASPENWIVMAPDGTWNDTIHGNYHNQGYIIEFEPSTAIDYIAQQNDITNFRDGVQVHDADEDGAYGTAGYVFFCVGSGPPGGALQFGPAEPLTYDQNGFTTLVREPSYASFHSVGQNYVVGGGDNPMISDPRGAPSSNARVQAGLAIHNNTSRTFYEPLMDFTITTPPPPVFRVGVAIKGDGEDRMGKVRLERSGGAGPLAVAETVGRPATAFHFFDIKNARMGDTFVLYAQKGADSGTNPNVAFVGMTFD